MSERTAGPPPLDTVVGVVLAGGEVTLAYQRLRGGKRRWFFPCPKIYFDFDRGRWGRYTFDRVTTRVQVQDWFFLPEPDCHHTY